MKTTATVIKTEDGKAYVKAFRSSACEGCKGCDNSGKCHTEMLLSEAPKSYELEVKNEIGAKPGDIVEVSSVGNGILIFAVVVFLLPIILAVISYFIAAQYLGPVYTIAVSGAVFIVSFMIVSFISNKVIVLYSTNLISKIIKENSGGAVYTNAYKE